MPTYEYQCEKCRKSFDAVQSMKDIAFATCPKELCKMKTWGKGKVKRMLGAGAGLIFKGSGFYITDYRSNSYKEGAKNDKPAETKPSETPKPAAPEKKTPSTPVKPKKS
jgi:putative FmdB family regulatory protein